VLDAAPPRATTARAGALHAAAGLAWAYGDLDQAVSLDEQALAIYEELGDRVRSANALVFLGPLSQAVGRTEGRETIERGLERLEEAGDAFGVTIAIGNLSDFALQDADYAAAAQLAEQASARAAEHGFELIEAMSACNHVVALIHLGDLRAGEVARTALRLCVRTTMHVWIGNCLFAVAATIAAEEPARAAILLGASEAELQGVRLGPAERGVYDGAVEAARAALGPDSFERRLDEGRLLGRDAAVELALGAALSRS
jgi:hypothetical protein